MSRFGMPIPRRRRAVQGAVGSRVGVAHFHYVLFGSIVSASYGTFFWFPLGASTLPFIRNVFAGYRYGRVVTVDDPWGFRNSLEWATSGPPPRRNFTELLRIRSERPALELHHRTWWNAYARRRTSGTSHPLTRWRPGRVAGRRYRTTTRHRADRSGATRSFGGVLPERNAEEDLMTNPLGDIRVSDGDVVATEHIRTALTAGRFVYDDGATQVFEPAGATIYVEHGRPTEGEWYLDDQGRFCSFWPPSYRACYNLRWIVEDGGIVGLRFTELVGGSGFNGRYR